MVNSISHVNLPLRNPHYQKRKLRTKIEKEIHPGCRPLAVVSEFIPQVALVGTQQLVGLFASYSLGYSFGDFCRALISSSTNFKRLDNLL
ncbi:hypothetical protein TNCT_138561 [Trichonephila clavata]|uniref:Uncharacterized protein n=1 Tax=Trichonephila clavata TaxID=2740835 RepID=A0A8X6GWB8_TRICU|nr:hypothetical protein TNCT_138561 [Trichonephila clavata]